MSGNNLIPVGVAFVESSNRLVSIREPETYSFPQVPRAGETVNTKGVNGETEIWQVDCVIYWTEPLDNFRDNPRVSLLLIKK